MWIFVEPFDVWLFRDAKPFTQGEQVRATGHFPPLPTTFQGAIRSTVLARALEAREKTFADFKAAAPEVADLVARWGGGADDFGRFRLRGPFIARSTGGRVSALLPPPRDLLMAAVSSVSGADSDAAGDPGRSRLTTIRPLEPATIASEGALVSGNPAHPDDAWPAGLGLPGLAKSDGGAGHLEPVGGLLDARAYRRYLLGTPGEELPVRRGDLPDLRIGIELERRTGTAKHGQLYLAHFTRLDEHVGLAAEITFEGGPEDTGLGDRGVLAIGGEARGGRYQSLDASPLAAIEDEAFKDSLRASLTGERFKLVLAMPGVFTAGWCPPFLDSRSLKGTLHGVPVRLFCAAVEKPVPVTGWDHQRNEAKTLSWAAPAASVYWLEVMKGAPGDWRDLLIEKVHGRSIAIDDKGESMRGHDIGMALAFVGAAGDH